MQPYKSTQPVYLYLNCTVCPSGSAAWFMWPLLLPWMWLLCKITSTWTLRRSTHTPMVCWRCWLMKRAYAPQLLVSKRSCREKQTNKQTPQHLWFCVFRTFQHGHHQPYWCGDRAPVGRSHSNRRHHRHHHTCFNQCVVSHHLHKQRCKPLWCVSRSVWAATGRPSSCNVTNCSYWSSLQICTLRWWWMYP